MFINTTDLVCHIEELKPDTQYEFSVKVTKGKRKSTWSMSVTNTTQEAGKCIFSKETAGPHSAVGKVSDCRPREHKFSHF